MPCIFAQALCQFLRRPAFGSGVCSRENTRIAMHQSTAARESSSEKRPQHWDDVADGWARWLEWIERNYGPVTDWLETAAAWHSSTRMLDVACGAGYPALTAAARMRDGATIVAT